MADEKTIALFGCGGWGRNWVDAVFRHGGLLPVAFIDRDPVVLQSLKSRGATSDQLFSDPEAAMKSVRPWAITCSIPAPDKQPVLLWALRNGIHTITDKPVAHGVAHVRELLATHGDSVFQVAQNYRCYSGPPIIRRLIDSGALGQPGAVTCQFLHNGRYLEPKRPLGALPGWTPLGLEMSIHHFDLARFFLKSEPVSAIGDGWRHEWSWGAGYTGLRALLRFPVSVPFTYHADWSATGPETGWGGHWSFVFERGHVVWRQREGLPTAFDEAIRPFDLAAMFEQPVEKPLTDVDTLVIILERLIRAATAGELPFCPLEDNIRSVAIVHALEESQVTGAVVDLHRFLDETYELASPGGEVRGPAALLE